jgi:hypothetical protein
VNFADFALAPDLASPGSHACPGKEFGLQTIFAFLRAFVRAATPYGGVKRLWAAHKSAPKGSKGGSSTPAMPPEEIKVTYFNSTPFELQQMTDTLNGRELGRADAWLRSERSAEERTNKFYTSTNENTQLMIWAVQKVVDPTTVGTSDKITAELLPKQDYADEWIHMPFGGIKIISRDEDQPPAWLKVWARVPDGHWGPLIASFINACRH